jgi:SHS2 domain-containing protein
VVGRWTLLEEVAIADCALEVDGASLDDLFATAGRAVAEIMVDPATVPPTEERTLALTAPSLELLLYDWLSELLFLKDSEQMVFPQVTARVSPGSPCRLSATMAGSRIGADTGRRADPKAVTLHRFWLGPADGGWRASVVLDI